MRDGITEWFRKHKYVQAQRSALPYRVGSACTYQCQKCGKVLILEPWQIKDLPWGMARGCKGGKRG